MRLDRGQRPNPIAVAARLLEVQQLARCLHASGEIALDPLRVALQEVARLRDQGGVVVFADAADARRRAPLDLVQQAGTGARGEHRVGAASQQKCALQRGKSSVYRPRRGERPEVITLSGLRAAVLQYARERMIGGHQDAGERLVVAQQDIVTRPQALDQVRLEQQRLGFGVGCDELHRRRVRDHAVQPRPESARTGVRADALLEVARLADVEHLAARLDHAIDAGSGGQRREARLDHGGAGRALDRNGIRLTNRRGLRHTSYLTVAGRAVNEPARNRL